MKLPQVNEVWRHFKGGDYDILGFCWDAVGDNLVLMVRYGNDGVEYCRTISNFLEPVNGHPRFTFHG